MKGRNWRSHSRLILAIWTTYWTLKMPRWCSRDNWGCRLLAGLWLSRAGRADCRQTRGKPRSNRIIVHEKHPNNLLVFWQKMVQWRTCSTETLLTTQARQRTGRWAERHRESRRKSQKMTITFHTVRAAFIITTSDCKSAASAANHRNGSCEANQKEKLKKLLDTNIS